MKYFSILFLSLFMFVSTAFSSPYTGYISSSNGDVIANGGWNNFNGGFKIAWDITPYDNYVHYEYTITKINGSELSKDVSHLILEVSSNFTLDNIYNLKNVTLSDDSPKTYTSGSSNPNMPNSIFGLKFENFEKDEIAKFSFDSDRLPMLGDFYAKDGKNTYAFNSGLYYDKNNFKCCCSDAKILVPDTTCVDIPPTYLLLGSALLFLLGKRQQYVKYIK